MSESKEMAAIEETTTPKFHTFLCENNWPFQFFSYPEEVPRINHLYSVWSYRRAKELNQLLLPQDPEITPSPRIPLLVANLGLKEVDRSEWSTILNSEMERYRQEQMPEVELLLEQVVAYEGGNDARYQPSELLVPVWKLERFFRFHLTNQRKELNQNYLESLETPIFRFLSACHRLYLEEAEEWLDKLEEADWETSGELIRRTVGELGCVALIKMVFDKFGDDDDDGDLYHGLAKGGHLDLLVEGQFDLEVKRDLEEILYGAVTGGQRHVLDKFGAIFIQSDYTLQTGNEKEAVLADLIELCSARAHIHLHPLLTQTWAKILIPDEEDLSQAYISGLGVCSSLPFVKKILAELDQPLDNSQWSAILTKATGTKSLDTFEYLLSLIDLSQLAPEQLQNWLIMASEPILLQMMLAKMEAAGLLGLVPEMLRRGIERRGDEVSLAMLAILGRYYPIP